MVKISRRAARFVADRVRREGFEVLPDEVDGLVNGAYAKIKSWMKERGHDLSDVEIRRLVAEVLRNRGGGDAGQ